MEHTPGLETRPPGSDTLDVAGGVDARPQREKREQNPLIAVDAPRVT